MSDRFTNCEPGDSVVVANGAADVVAASRPLPWLTWGMLLLCLGIHVGLLREGDLDSWEGFAKFGYLPATAIWNGAVWALVSSVFVHVDLIHLLFNAYWIWALGGRLEQRIGTRYYLGFVLATAFVSSAFQLAISGQTGIGASGVVYAMFGYMWVCRRRDPRFSEVLSTHTIRLFMIWLVGCYVVSALGLFEIGNVAHVSGVVLGALLAGAFGVRFWPWLMKGLLGVLVIASLVTLLWCPWLPNWSSNQAFKAHSAGEYEKAIGYYSKVLEKEPENAWALENRALAYWSTEDYEKAAADNDEARRINPMVEIIDRPEVGF